MNFSRHAKWCISWLEASTWKNIAYSKQIQCNISYLLLQVKKTSIGWSLGYMLGMSNMIPSEVNEIPPMTDPVFAGLIFLFSALTIVAAVLVFIILIRTCYWVCNIHKGNDLPSLGAAVILWVSVGCYSSMCQGTCIESFECVFIFSLSYLLPSISIIHFNRVSKNWSESLKMKSPPVYPASVFELASDVRLGLIETALKKGK